jgi:hypothetical protein
MSNIQKYFNILGINSNATIDEVKQAYKDLAFFYHPDRVGDHHRRKQKAEEKLKEVNEAYEIVIKYLEQIKNQKSQLTEKVTDSEKSEEIKYKQAKTTKTKYEDYDINSQAEEARTDSKTQEPDKQLPKRKQSWFENHLIKEFIQVFTFNGTLVIVGLGLGIACVFTERIFSKSSIKVNVIFKNENSLFNLLVAPWIWIIWRTLRKPRILSMLETKKPLYWKVITHHLLGGRGLFYVDRRLKRKRFYVIYPIYLTIDLILSLMNIYPFVSNWGYTTFIGIFILYEMSFFDAIMTCKEYRTFINNLNHEKVTD